MRNLSGLLAVLSLFALPLVTAGVAAAQTEATTEVEATADAEVAVEGEAAPAETQTVTLEDGTVVNVRDGKAFVVGADGTETPAPDGVHTAADGSTLETLNGEVVVPEAAAEGEAAVEDEAAADAEVAE